MKIPYPNEDSDVLTAVLKPLHFQGRVFCDSEFTAPWALKQPASDCAHFHVFTRGGGWVKVEGYETQLPAAGRRSRYRSARQRTCPDRQSQGQTY